MKFVWGIYYIYDSDTKDHLIITYFKNNLNLCGKEKKLCCNSLKKSVFQEAIFKLILRERQGQDC